MRSLRVGVPTSLQDANHATAVRFYSFHDSLGRGGFGANRSSARIRCRVRSVVLRPLATGRCYPPREAVHRLRSNGALLNQACSRRLPPTRRRSRHRLRRRRPRGALRIQLTAGDPDAAVRVSAACDLVTSQTALFARAPARTEPGRGRRTQAEADA